MLKKGSIQQTEHQAEGFFKQYYLGKEKRWRISACGELKISKPVHYISAFQNGRFILPPRITAGEGDYMYKLDMKDAYFSVPLQQSSRNYVRLSWSGNLYEFFCSCFGLGPATRIFTKLLKIPISVLRRINIWVFGGTFYNGLSSDRRNSHVERYCNLPPAIWILF